MRQRRYMKVYAAERVIATAGSGVALKTPISPYESLDANRSGFCARMG